MAQQAGRMTGVHKRGVRVALTFSPHKTQVVSCKENFSADVPALSMKGPLPGKETQPLKELSSGLCCECGKTECMTL